MMWTVGNHGDYHLDETTLTSDMIDIDWENYILNVPWGIRNRDYLMMAFNYHPGFAWYYKLHTDTYLGPSWYQAHIDSSFISARTGDSLFLWACRNVGEEIKFFINVLEPANDANIVLPLVHKNENGWYDPACKPHFPVSYNAPGMDTIYNVPFATRSDTLLKYLEKAANASWEFVWIDGIERPDLKNGDILKVIAEKNVEKEYFIKVQTYQPGHNAKLSSITWPDIPAEYKNNHGFDGDSIALFFPNVFSYRVKIPAEAEGFPSFIAKTEDPNARVEVERAVNLYGSKADRTVTFTATAEDDTTVLNYKVELLKEKSPEQTQNWYAEPFVSQYVFHDQWSASQYEICNPGTAALDLSNYMLIMGWEKDPKVLLSQNPKWPDRYCKYIPGYKWLSETEWVNTPGICEVDPNVNPIVQPGDVFCLGKINYGQAGWMYNSSPGNWGDYWLPYQMDIIFNENPWGEDVGNHLGSEWSNASWYLFKILNDSIKLGKKAANDPDDFELIETWNRSETGDWVIGGRTANADNQCVTWIRKPEIYKGNPETDGSFGNTDTVFSISGAPSKTADGSSEWLTYDRSYGLEQGYTWPNDILYITTDIGQHFMHEVTDYMSTIYSYTYKVSPGYSSQEVIRGTITNTTANEFLNEIEKRDQNQTLVLQRNGNILLGEDVLINGDSLVVTSANGENTTKYLLEVTDEGLSVQVLLTSDIYTIVVEGSVGEISGFDYGTELKDIVSGVTIPAGASMVVTDQFGAYKPLQHLISDTAYVPTKVNDQIFFIVTAEDGETTISYRLKPDSESSDAFVLSDIYIVDETTKTIKDVAPGTSVSTFYQNLVPAAGATMQVKDKAGFDRVFGTLYLDDHLEVTAADGNTSAHYFLYMFSYPPLSFLAYVLSDTYIVNQNILTIGSVPQGILSQETKVKDFKANLSIPDGTNVIVLDKNNNEKENTDFMEPGDRLLVSAYNGTQTTYYSVDVYVGIKDPLLITAPSVYPNPSTGLINIDGLEIASSIRIYNATGKLVLEKEATNRSEQFLLSQAGFYIICIWVQGNVKGLFKLIVE